MPINEIAVDIPGLHGAHVPMEQAKEQLLHLFTQLASEINTFWGSDEMGRYFAMNFVPSLEDVFKRAGELTDGLESIVGAIVDWAKVMSQTEQAVADAGSQTNQGSATIH